MPTSHTLEKPRRAKTRRSSRSESDQSARLHDASPIEQTVTINRSPDELYQFWRNFTNLPQFMYHLEAVEDLGDDRTHWVVKAPAGGTVEWDAEIINDKPGELIAWHSLPDADVVNAGTVRFEPATGGRGTVVRVMIKFDPPGGKLGAAIAKLSSEDPNKQTREDLRRFKQLMEAGETATTVGQPHGAGRRSKGGTS